MAKSKNDIIDDITTYAGGKYSEWYAGIAANPRVRLFNDHQVNEEKDSWIYRLCEDSDVAREIEEHLLGLGFCGGGGGGDETSKSVYAYKISNHSKE